MKIINILSLVQAYKSLNDESFKKYLNHYGIDIKDNEVEDLNVLVNALYKKQCKDNEVEDLNVLVNTLYKKQCNINILNQYYVSYKIPQIGKEFDLLRIGKDTIINIEIKRTATENEVKKQLKRNKYYLKFTKKNIYNFSFVSNIPQLYRLSNEDMLEKVDILCLESLLIKQEICSINNIDDLFNPTNYLVSPFNSTDEFINNYYFLTQHQEEIKNDIIKLFNNNETANFVSVTGRAGTGKTLLTYDIARTIIENGKKPLIIHCGNLNDGQYKLNSNDDWDIIPIKAYSPNCLSKYYAVIIDEAQRIWTCQLQTIIKAIKCSNGNCIFSYDNLQTLSNKEETNNIASYISDNIPSIKLHELKKKIRTNKEIATFIKYLFKNQNHEPLSTKNIQLNYFNNTDDAKYYIDTIDSEEWEVIYLTPSQRNHEYHEEYSDNSKKTSHKVIGQEFDNVAVIIDKFFSYNSNSKLTYTDTTYYSPVKMLRQNITRTRERLNLIIIENSALLDICTTILKG